MGAVQSIVDSEQEVVNAIRNGYTKNGAPARYYVK